MARVHGRSHHGKIELEGVELPGDVDVVRITGSSGRDDRNVVKAVSLTTGLPDPDVDFHSELPPNSARASVTVVARGQSLGSPHVPRPWSLIDFFLVILGGLAGAAVLLPIGVLLGGGELSLVLALAGQYIGHLVVLWLLARRREDLGFNIVGSDTFYLGLGLLLQLALAVLFLPLTSLLFPEGDSAQQVGTALSGLETTPARVAAVLTAVVVAPVTEELTFRGVLLKAFHQRGRRTIMVLTSLVFAAFHMLGLDPERLLQAAAVVLPQLFLVGLVLAWITLRTGRLGPAIFIHSGFNLLAALVLLLPPELLEPIT